MTAPIGNSVNDIVVSDLKAQVDLTTPAPVIGIEAAWVVVPQGAFRHLVETAARSKGVSVDAELTDRGFRVRLPMGPLRVTAEFVPKIASDSSLMLQPAGGIPGWMIGLGGRLAEGVPGIEIQSNGVILVDVRAVLPPTVRLLGRLTSLQPGATQLTLTIGQ